MNCGLGIILEGVRPDVLPLDDLFLHIFATLISSQLILMININEGTLRNANGIFLIEEKSPFSRNEIIAPVLAYVTVETASKSAHTCARIVIFYSFCRLA